MKICAYFRYKTQICDRVKMRHVDQLLVEYGIQMNPVRLETNANIAWRM